ncbi:hypothetical protein BDV26DRAFT_283036 [Aspergillus bertholletiae]|uniref:Uncharacterized protein n=1 Tax=Aspergillus bertholletiae TaxID=1226010 RepID=A0A5N7B1Q7_9EURO|nr:hypothetical protein BDV26DRAFT_283036 [Aspergillus bertholletiae]
MVVTYEAASTAAPSARSQFLRLLIEINSRSELFINGWRGARLDLIDAAEPSAHALETHSETLGHLGVFSPITCSDDPEATGNPADDQHAVKCLLKHLAAMREVTEAEHSTLASRFRDLMPAYHHGQPSWMDEGSYPSSTFLVDVAILGDTITPNLLIKWIAQDFFTKRLDGQIILSKLVASVALGYSKLLINEIVAPKTGGALGSHRSDISRVAYLAARQRAEQQ